MMKARCGCLVFLWLAGCSLSGSQSASKKVAPPESQVSELSFGNSFNDLVGAPAPVADDTSKLLQQQAQTRQAPFNTATPGPDPRLVYYLGFAKLRVTDPTSTLQQAGEIVELRGGYVESLEAGRTELRVPVESFLETYEALLKLGDVVQRSVTAQDITERVSATALRLKTLRTSRDRLIELLSRASNEQEKLNILHEIKRLTEALDQLTIQLDELRKMASFSRITLEVDAKQPKVEHAEEELFHAFRWIHALSPFEQDLARAGEPIELETPDSMAALTQLRHWMAEGPDGAQVWAHERKNAPAGSNGFWLDAIEHRLKARFTEVKRKTAGGFDVLRFVDGSAESYRYLVAINAYGSRLQVVEVYFPSPAHEERHGAAIMASISKGIQ